MGFVYSLHVRRSYFPGASLGFVPRSNDSRQMVASRQDLRGTGLPFRIVIGICRHSGDVHRTCQPFEDARLSSRTPDVRSICTWSPPVAFYIRGL